MQQPCHRCGYDSDRPTRFCRQCGAQLFVENEASSASTLQYAPQQSANPYDSPYQSQIAQAQAAPGGRFDSQTPDTSRLYHTPMGQNYPSYPANYQQAEAKKSGAWKWVLIALLCVMLVSVGIGAMVISAIRAKQAAAMRIRDKAQKAIDAAKEAAGEAEEAGELLRPLPPLPPPASGKGIDQYKYPNAVVKNSVNFLGNNVVSMSTNDSVSKVSDHYKKQLGDPMVEDEDGATVIFQNSDSPMIIIKYKWDSKKTEITLVRPSY